MRHQLHHAVLGADLLNNPTKAKRRYRQYPYVAPFRVLRPELDVLPDVMRCHRQHNAILRGREQAGENPVQDQYARKR
ncbi:hypothetical protein BC938DRAFT_475526, partial [Jimgerdemannia flammicorona]